MAWDPTSPEGAAQVFPRKKLCRPFRADRSSIPDPGFQSPLSRALPPWALLLRAFSATSIDLSLTRMPEGATQVFIHFGKLAPPLQGFLLSFPNPGLSPWALLCRPFRATTNFEHPPRCPDNLGYKTY